MDVRVSHTNKCRLYIQVQIELTTENPPEESKRTSIISRSKLSNLLQKTLRNKLCGLVSRGSKPHLAVRVAHKYQHHCN